MSDDAPDPSATLTVSIDKISDLEATLAISLVVGATGGGRVTIAITEGRRENLITLDTKRYERLKKAITTLDAQIERLKSAKLLDKLEGELVAEPE